jgi:hypothetical protein
MATGNHTLHQDEVVYAESLVLGGSAAPVAVAATATQINAATVAASASRTATAAGSITAADHNLTVYLNNATGFATALPAPIAGFHCKVVSKTSNTSGNHTLTTSGSANIIKGFAANAAGALVTPLSDGDTISFVANQSVAGDQVTLDSDGTSWFMSGFAQVAAGVTLTKAS